MSGFTLPDDSVSTAFFLGLKAGTRVVHEAADRYGWEAVQAAGPGSDLDAILSEDQQAQLFGVIKDILGGRMPSPFAHLSYDRQDAK